MELPSSRNTVIVSANNSSANASAVDAGAALDVCGGGCWAVVWTVGTRTMAIEHVGEAVPLAWRLCDTPDVRGRIDVQRLEHRRSPSRAHVRTACESAYDLRCTGYPGYPRPSLQASTTQPAPDKVATGVRATHRGKPRRDVETTRSSSAEAPIGSPQQMDALRRAPNS